MNGIFGNGMRRTSGLIVALSAGLALLLGARPALAQTTTPGTSPLVFSNAQVGVSSGAAQNLTETFTLTGYSTVLSPTATMNYGLSYKIGTLTCTGVAGNQTCTVSVTFQPTYPGGRKDAIFLMNGDTRLATVLVYGIGTAPFALLQPGVVTSPDLHTTNYVYGSVSDENGTVYLVQQGGNQILQVTSAGVVSVVPITGLLSPREIGIDGAGVMYVADQKPNSAITTFDLVQGIQGTFPWPVPNDLYIQTVTVGNTGTVYEGDESNIYVFAPGATNGTVVPITPAVTQPLYIDVDDQEDLFILGYTLNELPFGGTQKAVGTGGELFGMGIDAAETLYYEGSTPGVAEFPASNYNASEAVVDAGVSVLGASVQPNGTVDVSSDLGLDIVDRSQTTVAFGNQTVGVSATGQTVQLYNGGNETLTVSNVALSGSPAFTLGTATSTTCKSGKTVAPGAFCQVVLEFLSNNPGSFTGSLVFTTNSLNTTTSTSTVTFSATITGAYMVPSPASLDFGSVTDGTTSVTKTITLTNEGAGYAASVYSPASTDPAFTVSLGTCNVNIAVGDSCQLNVTFSPTAMQSYSATGSAQVTNAGPGNAPPVSFSLAGNGAAPPAVTLSPTSIAFAPQNIGTTSAVTKVKVTNSGAGSLSITGATITGTDPSDFAVDASGCAAALAANASCNLSVTFSPAAAGSFSGSISLTDNAPDSPQTVPLTGTGASVTESGNLWFNPAPVAVGASSAQTLTATFTITGETSLITPTAKMNYGLAYKVGKITCTGTAGNQTCTVPVTFIPNYPGGRKDALFLMNGTTRLATQLAFGVGQSPFALIQPGVITSPIQNNADYLYNSVVDENGTAYVEINNSIDSITEAGVVTSLAVAGPNSNSNLSIDGAGVIYFGAPPAGGNYVTYDTVQGIVGSVPTPVGAVYYDAIASGNEGNLYMVDNDNGKLYTVKPDGTSTGLVLAYPGLFGLIVDSNENLFGSSGGNGSLDEITAAATPVQSQINSQGGNLGIDAANTIYIERFGLNGIAGVGELPASGYANAVGLVDPNSNPTGNGSVAPDGTVYVGNYNNFDKVDRSQGAPIAFGEQSNGSPSQPASFQVYNGGNENLVLATFAVTGDGFAIPNGTTDTCTAGMTIKPGALCNAPIVFTGTHSGNFTGNITFTSNTLNTTATSVSVPLSAYINGIYVTVSPNPLSFGNQTDGTTSASKTVTFTNTGVNADANIGTPSSVDGFTISQGTCTSNIAPGSSCSFNVTFSPTAVQAYTGTVNVTAGSDASTQTQSLSFTLNGTGTAAAAPAASLSPTTISFPSTTVGSTAAKMSTTLSNTGNATLNISGITLTGANPTDFAETTTCGSTLAAGKTCTISATFTPAAATTYTASISVADDATGSPQTVSLSGTGNGGVTATPTSLNMGSETEYTENYTPQYITLTNNTSSTVTFSNFQSADPSEFNSQAYTCSDGGVLLANSSCELSVRFSPLSVGTITSSITMPYTGAGGGTIVVNLTGIGTAGTPAIDLYPLPVNFGQLPILNAATPISLQVEATGTAPLTGIGFTITGTNAADFTETDNCSGVTIDPYPGTGTCNVTVSFTPTAGGPRSATLNVTSNSGSATFSTPLSGAGVAQPAQLQFSPTQLNLVAGAGGPCADATTGGLATAATLCNITGSAQDYLGNTYLVDNTYNAVYKIDTTGTISVFAGTPSKTGGYTGDNGPATSATLSGPTAVAADAFGNIYVSDTGNGAIREIDTTGMITSFLDGTCEDGGKGTPKHRSATAKAGRAHPHEVQLCEALQPEGLVVDSLGNLIFADTVNNVVLSVVIATGDFTLVAGDAAELKGIAGYNGDNRQADSAELNAPQDVAVDTAGNIYIADTLNYRIRKVTTATGVITTVAGDGTQGDTGDTAAATSATINAYGVSTDLAGDIFIASGTGGIVRKVDASGNINLFAGGGTGAIGGPASTGAVANAWFARTDNSGDLLIPAGTQLLAAGPDGLLQFGSESIGTTTSALNVTLENTGDTPLTLGTTVATVTGTDAADFALTSSTCGYNLQPGKTCVLSVTFDPTATGARTASLSIPTNAAGSPQIVLLQGNGSAATAPAASLSPTTISFPDTAVGSTATAISTTLSNTGTAVLNISGITIAGANPSDFAETTTCGSTLDAGKNCTISATFTPAAVASYTASISVADNATGSPQTATLSGNGTAAPAPVASLSPTTLSFPNTTVGTTATAISTTLSNTGNATLNISGITLGGTNPADFAETTTCGSTLAAGQNCTISVTFTPAAAASYTASLSVADNATGSPQTATLSGTGTPAPAPVASLSPTALSFPSTTAGTTATALSTTLSNTGNATLNITGITLTGANPTDFAIATTGTTCGTTLAAGSTCTIAATFTPTAAGSFTASISVADNAASSPQTATLTGTGNAPLATDFTITATPPAQTVAPGSVATFTINTTGIGGDFDNAIQLTATGLPNGYTASFSPSSITPGANGASSTLSIQTTSLAALAHPHPLHRAPRAPWLAVLLVVPLLGLRKRFSKLRGVSFCLLLLSSLAPVLMLTGCSGGYYNLQTKTYTVTVTGTSGSTQHSTTVTLTVQQ